MDDGMATLSSVQFLVPFLVLLQIENSGQAALKIEDDPHVPFIEAYLRGLTEKDFQADSIVFRAPSADVVKFKNPADFRNGTTVFNQKAQMTEAKDVIILSGYDDNIRRSDSSMTEQRVWVTLRKKGGSADQYYVNYAYVR